MEKKFQLNTRLLYRLMVPAGTCTLRAGVTAAEPSTRAHLRVGAQRLARGTHRYIAIDNQVVIALGEVRHSMHLFHVVVQQLQNLPFHPDEPGSMTTSRLRDGQWAHRVPP